MSRDSRSVPAVEKPLIALPMETKARDLDARLYLAMKFVRDGFPCVVGFRRDVREYVGLAGAPFVYMDKGGPKTERGLAVYDALRASAGVIMLLDEEGGIYQKGSTALLARNNDGALSAAELTFLWGPTQKEDLLAASKVARDDTVFVTGHPRFDLRKPRFGPFYKALGADVRGVLSQYILVNTSFGRGNHQMRFQSLLRKRERITGRWFDRERDVRLYHYQRLVLLYLVEAIRRMAERFRDRTIVVRPHPIENEAFYKEQFRGWENVVVTREGSVQEWIVDAALVIHHACTTSVEAFFYEVPVVAYVPLFDPHLASVVPVQISDHAQTDEELLHYVENVLVHGRRLDPAVRRARMDVIGRVIANVDFDAAERIVSIVRERLPRIRWPAAEDTPERRAFLRTVRRRRVVRALSRALRLDAIRRRPSLSKQKFPGLRQDEVERRAELFRQIEPDIPPVHAAPVGEGAYLLTRRS